MNHQDQSGFLFILLFSLAIFAFTFLALGCYYETNDDVILTFLLKGVFNKTPILNLTLYLHGFGSLITLLYQNLPQAPWYGLVMYSILFLATVLAFWLIYKQLHNKLSMVITGGLLLLFYLATWYEHIFWFNYSRLPILLAGMAGLWANRIFRVNAAKKKMYFLFPAFLFLIALCVRPSLALFGLALVLPNLLISLQLKTTKVKLLLLVLTGILFFAALTITTLPEQLQYRRYDVLKSQILDYSWYCPPAETLPATLQQEAIAQWFLADTFTLQYLDEQVPDWQYFWQNVAQAKLIQLGKYLVLDHFLTLFLVFVFFIWFVVHQSKRQVFFFCWYHLYFWSIILVTGLFLKIPPRILTPAMSLYLLSHLAWLPENLKITPWRRWPVYVQTLALGLLLVQVYKINHRVASQQQRQKQSEAVWTKIQNNYPGYVVLAAGLENELRAMSPFKNYDLHNQRLIALTSWQTLDPQYQRNWQKLTSATSLGQAIIQLSQLPNVVWVSNPEYLIFLKKYFGAFYHITLEYKFIAHISAPNAPEKLGYYQVRFK
ncbi:hypothetical protein HUW51_20055 [Adhaeribacter swui]|uniref:Glycosyltransferase family 39 protein n=1 Tax=Adhaeribacter swui TaxID=2086471 RepID=A0A7G7GCM0_9BACT|nr:hypothetical protein [Adhaeribacter swui]QNF34904.1 hypothetical protein HUW51_20055 [Adhaeribacter swui]